MLEGNIFDANRGYYYDAMRVDGNSFQDTKIDINETGFYDFETSRKFYNGRKKDFQIDECPFKHRWTWMTGEQLNH